MVMNSVDKSITIMVSIICISLCLILCVNNISNAYINSPGEFIIKFETDNNTLNALSELNGSIIINNNYDYTTKEYSLCKEIMETTILKEDGEVLKTERFENIYNCTFK